MRIAQIAPLYESVPPRLYGGTERVVSYLTEELVRQGHEVTLFASGDSKTSARLVAGCPRALRLENFPLGWRLMPHLSMLERVYQLLPEFDVTHFHLMDFLHFSMMKRQSTPSLSTMHWRLDLPVVQDVFHSMDNLAVNSISDAQRLPMPNLHWQGTVHHGLPRNLYAFHGNVDGYLAFLGRVSKQKGLIDAVKIAKRAGMRLKIAAKIDKSEMDYFDLKAFLRRHSNAEYIGEISDAEKNAFLGNARALLFPIKWPEPFGLTMIEAMACGTPVIAYAEGSVPEVIENGVNGFIVRSPEEAVQAVGRLDRIDRHAVRARFEQRFTAEIMTKNYVAIYEKLRQSFALNHATNRVREASRQDKKAITPYEQASKDSAVDVTALEKMERFG